jgi:hypothetical protein
MIYTSDKKIKLNCGKYALPIGKVQLEEFYERYDTLYNFLNTEGYISDSPIDPEIMDGLKQFLLDNRGRSIRELNENYYLEELQRDSVPDFGVITDVAFMVIICLTEFSADNVEAVLIEGRLAIYYFRKLIYVETEINNFFLAGDKRRQIIENLDAYRIESLATVEGIKNDVPVFDQDFNWQ